MFYYTYVLKSQKNGEMYIGWTVNLKVRLSKHNEGLVKATKSYIPYNLVYFEACKSKSKAILREKTLKTGFGRKFLAKRI
ncbi:MAG: GIY-YIG nuclease family protein [Candidatus Shapirobacteria bacterium]